MLPVCAKTPWLLVYCLCCAHPAPRVAVALAPIVPRFPYPIRLLPDYPRFPVDLVPTRLRPFAPLVGTGSDLRVPRPITHCAVGWLPLTPVVTPHVTLLVIYGYALLLPDPITVACCKQRPAPWHTPARHPYVVPVTRCSYWWLVIDCRCCYLAFVWLVGCWL